MDHASPSSPFLTPDWKANEKAVMPGRVVAHVVLEHLLGVVQFAGPEVVLVEVGEQPLAIGPGVVVFRVDLEGPRDEVRSRQWA